MRDALHGGRGGERILVVCEPCTAAAPLVARLDGLGLDSRVASPAEAIEPTWSEWPVVVLASNALPGLEELRLCLDAPVVPVALGHADAPDGVLIIPDTDEQLLAVVNGLVRLSREFREHLSRVSWSAAVELSSWIGSSIDVFVRSVAEALGTRPPMAMTAEPPPLEDPTLADDGAFPSPELLADPPSLEGDLDSFELMALLDVLRVSRRTGELQVVSSAGHASLMLDAGQLARIEVEAQPTFEQALVDAGVVDPALMADVLEMSRAHDRSVLDLLSQVCVLDAETVRVVAENRAALLLVRVAAWQGGRFAFYVRSAPAKGTALSGLTLDLAWLMLEAARLADEQAA
ncbi:MAG: DUF4388 domain-containing protein [Myxococcales bacterium]|nr:DUF4388 domain-containing protein [Myxococcales bacterium]